MSDLIRDPYDRQIADRAAGPGPEEKRLVLVHLNVEVPASDTRSADEIADAVLAALEVGSDDDRVRDLVVVSPLAEEV